MFDCDSYPNSGVSVGLRDSYSGIAFDVGRLRLAQRRQVLDIVVNIFFWTQNCTTQNKQSSSMAKLEGWTNGQMTHASHLFTFDGEGKDFDAHPADIGSCHFTD